MRTGAGFVELNTPKALSFTEGCTLTLADLESQVPESRASIVRLPAYMQHVRQGFEDAQRALGLRPLIEDEEDGDGSELPQLLKFVDKRHANPAAIEIVVDHFESGKTTFVLKDYDGVMAGADVPRIVQDADAITKSKEEEKYVVYPWTMNDVERAAFDRLFALWKTKANSNSASGQEHRKHTDRLLPDMSQAQSKRRRTESGGDGGGLGREEGDAESSATMMPTRFDDIDFAIQLAEELFR